MPFKVCPVLKKGRSGAPYKVSLELEEVLRAAVFLAPEWVFSLDPQNRAKNAQIGLTITQMGVETVLAPKIDLEWVVLEVFIQKQWLLWVKVACNVVNGLVFVSFSTKNWFLAEKIESFTFSSLKINRNKQKYDFSSNS